MSHDHPGQRGLAFSVAAYQGDLVAPFDGEVRSAEDMFGAERHPGLLDLCDDLSRTRGGRELDVERGKILLLDLDTLQTVELLDARLHLVRFGRLVAEFLDELLGLFDHPLLVFVSGHLLRPPFGTQHDVSGVGDFVVVGFAQRDLHRTGGHVIQKGAVVRDEQHRAVVVFQVILEPLDRLDVQVVGRLVQQENRGPAQQQFRQLDAHAPAARKFARGTLEVATLESQTEQRLLDVRFAGIAAQDVIMVGRFVQPVEQRFVVGRFVVGALGDFAGEAGDFGFELQHFVEGFGRLFDECRSVRYAHLLREVADRAFAVVGDRTRGGLLFAHDQTQQSRFTGAVLTDQADAVLGVDEQGYVVEKRPAAIADGEVV